jgi:hypothetical protein
MPYQRPHSLVCPLSALGNPAALQPCSSTPTPAPPMPTPTDDLAQLLAAVMA